MVPLLVVLLMPAIALADGMFVVPKFVWDKHKDINEPTQKAILVYDAGREDLILQVKFEGPVDEFGWLIPVPNLPTVQKGSMKCFYELSQYTQRHFEWGHQNSQTRSIPMSLGVESADKSEPPVKVIEIKTVGDYEIAVLSTKDTGALEKWLGTNQFYFPTDKTDVLDGYVKQQWYFIAVKINLKSGMGPLSTFQKLAGGELNPLQISFASDHCVFPLKISSVNGQPSEVQVYVLSPEPLLETTMLEKKLPAIYSNDMAQAARNAQSFERTQIMQRNMRMRFMGATTASDSAPSAEVLKATQRIREDPAEPGPDELLPYAKVTKTDLPDCSKIIQRLADKSWWLTKQTWTFKPEEMRDLEFESAISTFAGKLDLEYGYFAAASLETFGADAVPAFINALQNTNPAVRVKIAAIFNRGYGVVLDPRLTSSALTWLKDSESSVRMAGVSMLTEYPNWNPTNAEFLVPMLHDSDSGVRHRLAFALPRFRNDLGKYIPAFQEMLDDKDLNIRVSAVEMLERLNVVIPVKDLLPLFSVHDSLSQGLVAQAFYRESVSNDEIIPLLQNPEPVARLVALRILYQNANKQSVELALPLLNDSDQQVRMHAAATLRALSGQHFTADQQDQWQQWWTANKTKFVVQLHPEELQPRLPNSPIPGADNRQPPRPVQENPN